MKRNSILCKLRKNKSAKKSIQTLIVNNKEINDKDDILQAEVEYV